MCLAELVFDDGEVAGEERVEVVGRFLGEVAGDGDVAVRGLVGADAKKRPSRVAVAVTRGAP